jgi:hypothetical protein
VTNVAPTIPSTITRPPYNGALVDLGPRNNYRPTYLRALTGWSLWLAGSRWASYGSASGLELSASPVGAGSVGTGRSGAGSEGVVMFGGYPKDFVPKRD